MPWRRPKSIMRPEAFRQRSEFREQLPRAVCSTQTLKNEVTMPAT